MPGRPGTPIVVELETVKVPLDPGLDYEALSYTWGSPKNPIAIAVAQEDYYRTVKVTRNCAEALDALRLRDRPRLLWIDAMCINQKDEKEKSAQVSLMASIYRDAFRVTAWLGPALEDTKVAFDWIRKVNTHVSLNPQTNELSPLSDDCRWMQPGGYALIDEDEVCALARLLSHPWFERVWIWQEIRLGYSRAVLKCGKFEIAWAAFCAADRYGIGKTFKGPSHKTLLSRSDTYVRRLRDIRPRSILPLLDFMRSSKCRDRRDRLFAVRDMVYPDSKERLGQPDYSKHWHAVYTGLCVRSGTLDFLRFVTEHKEHELPSWVPDWTPSDVNVTIDGRAAEYTTDKALKFSGRRLSVKGRLVTTVQNVVRSTLRGNWGDSATGALQEGLSRLLQSTLIELGMNIDSVDISALSHVLTIGEMREAYHPANHHLPKIEELIEVVRTLATSSRTPSRLEDAMIHIASRCWGRSLLLMADGNFGLGPSHTQPGDSVSILLGCGTPMVQRLIADGEYHVIGAAYVSGLMEGQAFLGPLLPQYDFVWYEHKGQHYPAFRAKSDGSIRLRDPRLPGLSHEWRYIGSLDDPRGLAFENTKTEERRCHRTGPQLDAEAVEARGIKLDTITFV
ncbi:Heterokaryon incompatibility protein 6, OR allele [Pseudocercospora fuligena]|uniref:Heterokaryon incompatibility protein 6, OR allele n=1 Tax=Pseudocercospora fuligena TaxID=685502 RepID=A0A8H6VK93_9PEZI|nr:Heterokaryon incompatibility protein 6, OR allele [Pseudocercospora fuligena]